MFRHNGKVRWKSLRTNNLRDARKALCSAIDKASKNADLVKQNTTLNDLLNLYMEHQGGYAYNTQRNHNSIVKIIRATWSSGLDIKVNRITTAHLKQWLSNQSPRLKPATIRDYLKVIRGIFNLAIDAKILNESPVTNIKPPKLDKPIRLTPSWNQAMGIVEHIRNEIRNAHHQESADFTEMMLKGGIGLAEMNNLQGHHIDFTTNTITLFRQKTKTGYTIPIYPQLLPVVKKLETIGKLKPN